MGGLGSFFVVLILFHLWDVLGVCRVDPRSVTVNIWRDLVV